MSDVRLLRIAIVTHGYDHPNGVQTVARWLVDNLRGTGHKVTVFDLATSRADAYSRLLSRPSSWRRPLLATDPGDPSLVHVGAWGAEVEPFRYLPRRAMTAALRRFDVVQVVAGGPAPACAVRRCRVPTVLQVASTAGWERRYTGAAPGPARWWRQAMTAATSVLERSALRSVSAVLVENRRMLAFAESVGQPAVELAPPGVDTARFRPHPAGWQSGGYLLSLCRLDEERKALDRLVRAYGLMVRARPGLPPLVLAGRGPLPGPLARQIEDEQLTRRVLVRTDVAAVDLPGLYAGASVFLQSSHEEGLGLSLLEAMSCGLPVVSTATAGTLESVVDGETGWLVDQQPDVEAALARQCLAVLDGDGIGMSGAARRRAKSHFGTDVTLERFLRTYRSVLDHADQPAS